MTADPRMGTAIAATVAVLVVVAVLVTVLGRRGPLSRRSDASPYGQSDTWAASFFGAMSR